MSFTSDMRKAVMAIVTTVVASTILFMLLSLGEIGQLGSRVNALEKNEDKHMIQLDKIYQKVEVIHWYLIEKNDKVK